MISSENQKEIEHQARDILLKFGDALAKVPEIKVHEMNNGRSSRDEFDKSDKSWSEDTSFRELFFSNAPKKKGDFIFAEGKTW